MKFSMLCLSVYCFFTKVFNVVSISLLFLYRNDKWHNVISTLWERNDKWHNVIRTLWERNDKWHNVISTVCTFIYGCLFVVWCWCCYVFCVVVRVGVKVVVDFVVFVVFYVISNVDFCLWLLLLLLFLCCCGGQCGVYCVCF